MTDTIAAIATATGQAGIGVVRVSGPAARKLGEQITGGSLQPRMARYCAFRDINGEPVDHGIAQADRAVCTVQSGTDTPPDETGANLWYEGGGRKGERAQRDIVIYPPTRGLETQGDAFEPVRIGVLVDMDLGQLLADWIDPTILALEDALNEGVWGRSPVQIVTADARGLPRENYRIMERQISYRLQNEKLITINILCSYCWMHRSREI